jgi:nitronate monooxygenase
MTTLQQLFGIRHPIIQAPMAGVQASALAVAASEAGALGSLPAALLGLPDLRRELQAIRARTAQPFNVNFFCHVQPAFDAARDAAWRDALAPFCRELGLDPDAAPGGPGRGTFSAEAAGTRPAARPPVVSFHFGLPAPELVQRLRAWGARVVSSATTVDEARWLEARGVDAVIAQGLEAGGHRGIFLTEDLNTQVGTFALVRQVVQAVRVPVIAAGGIADAAGVRAALALGAAGVQVGTAFLLCDEATTAPLHRRALQSDAARVTALTNVFTGRPARGIVNRAMRELGPISAAAPAFPLATGRIGALRAKAESHGSSDFTPLWAGQNAAGCRAVPARQVVQALAEGVAG